MLSFVVGAKAASGVTKAGRLTAEAGMPQAQTGGCVQIHTLNYMRIGMCRVEARVEKAETDGCRQNNTQSRKQLS